MGITKILLCVFLVGSLSALKVYHFEAPTSSEGLSSLLLIPSPAVILPDRFILCTSHQQGKMDKRGFYHIYGDDGAPWMTTKFGTGPGPHNSVGLWGAFGSEWIYFGEIPEAKLYFWYHMCHKVDTVDGTISVSVNGQSLATKVRVESLMKNKPLELENKITLGKWTKVSTTRDYVDEQFLATLGNVNIFTLGSRSITKMSGNACDQEGDILGWSSSSWASSGPGISMTEEDIASVCSGKGRYDLALPVGLDQEHAVGTCAKLGQGRMTVSSSQPELRRFALWFERMIPGRCSNIWTPYSDEAEEGKYISLEDDTSPTFLPWAPGQPNGAQTENGVDVRLDFRNNSLPLFYYDQNSNAGQDKFICSSCSLAEYFSLKLMGVCEHTVMGKLPF